MESVIARVLKDPKQSIQGMRLLRFARNDRGLVSDPEGGIPPSVKRGYAKISMLNRKLAENRDSLQEMIM